ncbi:Uncharacterised protein [[Clostridium] sordellii]|nr:Uncharacterised protein [[Clostridium] sordellii] [Paeniclostridium sordellii]
MIDSNPNYTHSLNFFLKNKCFYVKDSFNNIRKLIEDIHTYAFYIDKYQIPHICLVDLSGVLHYFIYKDSTLSSINKFKLNILSKKIKNFSLYPLDDSLNIFFHINLNNKSSNIYHINFNFYNDKVSHNIVKNVSRYSKYKIKSSNNHLICCYNDSSINSNLLISIYFNDLNKSWEKLNKLDTIYLLFKFCSSLKYE